MTRHRCCCCSNVRPVRDVLRHVPAGRRTFLQKLLAPRHTRTPDGNDDGSERVTPSQRRAVCVDGNRLATIMTFPTLKTRFGEFCRKALCSEVCVDKLQCAQSVVRFVRFSRGRRCGDVNHQRMGLPCTRMMLTPRLDLIKAWDVSHSRLFCDG